MCRRTATFDLDAVRQHFRMTPYAYMRAIGSSLSIHLNHLETCHTAAPLHPNPSCSELVKSERGWDVRPAQERRYDRDPTPSSGRLLGRMQRPGKRLVWRSTPATGTGLLRTVSFSSRSLDLSSQQRKHPRFRRRESKGKALKVWITDRWMGVDPATKKKTVKKANFGSGSRWQVSHYAEQSDGTKKLVARNFERLVDAEAFRTKTEHELREGSYRSPEFAKKTFGDAAAAWLDGKKKPNGASLFRYRDALDIWALPTWSHRTLISIRRPDIEAWVSQLVEGSAKHAEGRRARGTGLSPAGLTAVWVPFKAALANAVDLG